MNPKILCIILIFLIVSSLKISFAQSSEKDNAVKFSAGILHVFSNRNKTGLLYKNKNIFNNISINLQFYRKFSKDLNIGLRFMVNKFGVTRNNSNSYLSIPMYIALNYRLIRRSNIYLQFCTGPVLYFDAEKSINLANSHTGYGIAVFSLYNFWIIESLFASIEWGLVYENSIPKSISIQNYSLYSSMNIGVMLNF